MAVLDADMRAIVERTLLCFAATTNPDGSPNLSPKSSLRVHYEGHLLFANIASPGTLRNLRAAYAQRYGMSPLPSGSGSHDAVAD